MTREEAVSIIKERICVTEYVESSYVDCVDIEALKMAIEALEQPEIIRCKDCKHYQFADNRAFGMPVKMCEWFGFEDVDDDDFCSRAERRTDEGET